MPKLPELGGGAGGGVKLIWAMPERKRAFSYDVFPKPIYCSYDSLLSFNLSGLAVEKVKLVIFFHLHQ